MHFPGSKPVMQPFYQGKIDNFCALYAILNALQLTHGLAAGKARDLYNEVLLELCRDEEQFRAVLTHGTDYVAMVDMVLRLCRREYPMEIHAPFQPGAPVEEVWRALKEYAMPDRQRTAIFRFCRYVPMRFGPLTDHWTTALNMDKAGLHLFDCSLEPKGMYYLRREALAPSPCLRTQEYYIIPAESIRLLAAL